MRVIRGSTMTIFLKAAGITGKIDYAGNDRYVYKWGDLCGTQGK